MVHWLAEATRLLIEIAAEFRNENSLVFGEKRNLILLDALLISIENCVFKMFQLYLSILHEPTVGYD